jgi:CubicO group peptidase (beta-lactamase class C family)
LHVQQVYQEFSMVRLIGIAIVAWISTTAAAAGATGTEDRIRRVTQQIPPPVLVRGESPPITSLVSRMAELNVPGVSIAVIHEGRIEWSRGFGVTRAGGDAVSEATLFQAASISKPVFALAVVRLADAGKLDLRKNVNEYLKSWRLPDNEFTRQSPVTLRGVLSHSAGLTVHGFPGYEPNAPVPDIVQILDGIPPANTSPIRADVPPGSRYRYSGGGYVLAQQVVMDVTGVPLAKLLHDSVLEPLGMSRSTFEQPLPASRSSEVAFGHRADGTPVKGGLHVYPEIAAAGLWTTPSDLARYALGVQAALSGKSKVISASTARTMLTPILEGHALGPRVGGKTSRRYFAHNGGNEGYRCLLVAYEDGEGAVVMTNGDNGGVLMEELMRGIASTYDWPDFAPPLRTLSSVKPEALERFVGAYELDDGSIYVVHKERERIVGHELGRKPLTLSPSSDDELFAREMDVLVNFDVAANKVSAIRHRLGDRERSGPRVSEPRSSKILAWLEATGQRFREQRADPQSGPAVSKMIAGFSAGKPEYDSMSPQLADNTRQQLIGLTRWLEYLGAMKSLTFQGVDEAGTDEFRAEFEKGTLKVFIRLGENGRIEAVNLAPG